MSQTFRPSQEILMDDETSCSSQYSTPSTQEIVTIQTQEASNATDFFDQLRASQISTVSANSQTTNSQTVSPASSQSMIGANHKTHINAAIFKAVVVKLDSDQSGPLVDANGQLLFDSNGNPAQPEKKRRGRKRKIRTAEELIEHLREKKEKNRLAAQRLRKKKTQEVCKYVDELSQLEANVIEKRRFADLIQTKVNTLRTKIEVMIEENNKKKKNQNTSKGSESTKTFVKSEPNQSRGKRLDLLEAEHNNCKDYKYSSELVRR